MNPVVIKVKERFGSFPTRGEVSNELRLKEVLPVIRRGGFVVFDMDGVENMTDSFLHALVANCVRYDRDVFFSNVRFRNCAKDIRTLIELSINFGRVAAQPA